MILPAVKLFCWVIVDIVLNSSCFYLPVRVFLKAESALYTPREPWFVVYVHLRGEGVTVSRLDLPLTRFFSLRTDRFQAFETFSPQ